MTHRYISAIMTLFGDPTPTTINGLVYRLRKGDTFTREVNIPQPITVKNMLSRMTTRVKVTLEIIDNEESKCTL